MKESEIVNKVMKTAFKQQFWLDTEADTLRDLLDNISSPTEAVYLQEHPEAPLKPFILVSTVPITEEIMGRALRDLR